MRLWISNILDPQKKQTQIFFGGKPSHFRPLGFQRINSSRYGFKPSKQTKKSNLDANILKLSDLEYQAAMKTKLLDMKNTVMKIKNSEDGLNRLDTTEEKIRKVD